MLDHLRPGDTVVVWKLDRLGRSLRHLLGLVGDLEARGVNFKSLSENLDTTTPGGRLIFHVLASLAEFERSLVIERTQAGLTAARARGRKGGRPRKLSRDQVKVAMDLYAAKTHTLAQIADVVGCLRSTLWRELRAVQESGVRRVARNA